MTKTDRLYHKLLEMQVVTIDDISDILTQIVGEKSTTSQIHKGYLIPLMNKGRMERIRQGLYIIGVPSDTGLTFPGATGFKKIPPDKFLVGSKLASNGFFGYHSALELHGASQSMGWKKVNVCVPPERRFSKLSYRGVSYVPVSVKDIEQEVITRKHKGQNIRVTSPERTFVDCIDNPILGGGWEEVMKSIINLRIRQPDKLVQLPIMRQRQSLIRRVGFVIDMLAKNSIYITGIGPEHVQRLEQQVKGHTQYLFRNKKLRKLLGQTVLDRKWKLYIPVDFWNHFVRGV
jgi:predicted transcriptional regulator of viral defense system